MTFRDTASVFERLVDNSEPTPGPLDTLCWVWQKGCCNKGYGHFYVYDPDVPRTGRSKKMGKSVEVRAHLASWALANGPIPADMTLDHLCVNTKCIRPSHLELVTRVENSRRAMVRRRASTRPIKRHTTRTTTVIFPPAMVQPYEQNADAEPYERNLEYEHLATLQ